MLCRRRAEPGREERVCKRLRSLLKSSTLVEIDALIPVKPQHCFPGAGLQAECDDGLFWLKEFPPHRHIPIPSLAEQVLQV